MEERIKCGGLESCSFYPPTVYMYACACVCVKLVCVCVGACSIHQLRVCILNYVCVMLLCVTIRECSIKKLCL